MGTGAERLRKRRVLNQSTKSIGWYVAATLAIATTSSTTAAAQAPQDLQPSWTYSSGTEGWIPETVSIGNDGTRVFTAYGTFGSSSQLFSDSAATIASDEQVQLSFHHRVDSSSSGVRRAWLHYSSPDPYTAALAELRVYAADSSQTQFTYTFPFTTQQLRFGGVDTSESGSRVSAWAYDNLSGNTSVVVFDGASSTPTVSVDVPTYMEPSEGKVSKNGERLYLGTGTKTFLVDLSTGQVTHAGYNTFSAGNGHALSPDGLMYARGTSANGLKIMQVQGQSQSTWYTHTIEGEYACSRMAFSGDGTLLAATFDGYVDRAVKLIVLDLTQSTPTVVYEHEVQGAGTLGLVSSDLEVNQDGSRIFVGTWGEETQTVPEVLIHSKNASGSWTYSHFIDLPGSTRDLDIDPTGDRLAVASKTIHASLFGGGGRYDQFMLSESEGTGLRLVGTPTAGGSIEVRVSCPPDKTGLLLASDNLATTPTNFGDTGRLFLERSGLQFLSRTTENGSGELVFTLSLATASAGDTIHVQGLVFGPRRLSPGALTIEVTD